MRKNNFYLYVYEYIRKSGKLPTKDVSKQKLNYYVKKLKRQDLIYKVGYGVWKINENKNFEEVKKVNDDTVQTHHKTRGHGFVFKVMIPAFDLWDQRDIFLRDNYVPFKRIKQGQSIVLRGHTIWLCNSSIVIYFSPKSSFYATSSYESSGRALIECKETIRAVERLIGKSLKLGKGWLVSEAKSHYADIRNVLSKYYHSKGISRFEVTQSGKAWAMVDNSFNLFELETIAGGGKSKEDLPKLQMFLNDLRDNPETLSNIKAKTTDELKDVYNVIREQNKIIASMEAQIIRLTNLIENK